uniref:Uncharacterized protein n=1 Tax=viral metagenome TaxID=1070528 RepID=A0A6M3IR37_9ZZZZ
MKETRIQTKGVCVKCGELWEREGSPGVCVKCGNISAVIYVAKKAKKNEVEVKYGKQARALYRMYI